MQPLAWLDDHDYAFPDIERALAEPNGLLAAGGDLSRERLIEAYRRGIFPWYDADQPILWWSPDPRCVIDPAAFKPSRSLARKIKKAEFEVRVDEDFESVIDACQTRDGDDSTWITSEMKDAYIDLHQNGVAHSVECYLEGKLAGGLYGLSLGNLFFGESMFHRVTDASKIAFSWLMGAMREQDCPLVDCQVANPHLFSLGAYEIPRSRFKSILIDNIDKPPIDWVSLRDRTFL